MGPSRRLLRARHPPVPRRSVRRGRPRIGPHAISYSQDPTDARCDPRTCGLPLGLRSKAAGPPRPAGRLSALDFSPRGQVYNLDQWDGYPAGSPTEPWRRCRRATIPSSSPATSIPAGSARWRPTSIRPHQRADRHRVRSGPGSARPHRTSSLSILDPVLALSPHIEWAEAGHRGRVLHADRRPMNGARPIASSTTPPSTGAPSVTAGARSSASPGADRSNPSDGSAAAYVPDHPDRVLHRVRRTDRCAPDGCDARCRTGTRPVGSEVAEEAVTAAEEEQRAGVGPFDVELVDPTDHDEVVTAVVHGVDRAVDPGQAAGESRGSEVGRVPGDLAELVVALAGERIADVDLILGEDVDAERTGGLDVRPAGRALVGQNATRGGSSDTEVNDPMASPGSPSSTAVTTVDSGGEVPQHGSEVFSFVHWSRSLASRATDSSGVE